MLKLKPRTIIAAILCLFALLLSVHHFKFSLTTQKDDSDLYLVNQIDTWFPLLDWIERTDFDLHLRYQQKKERHPDVVIVEVNEKSIQELGQFPFSRTVYGELIEKLEKYGARVAAFDITFPEIERNESLAELKKARDELVRAEGRGSRAVELLNRRISRESGDDVFAEALRKAKIPVVLGFAFSSSEAIDAGAKDVSPVEKEMLKRHFIYRRNVPDNAFVHSMTKRIPVMPHRALLESLTPSSSLGFFVADPDMDSVIRRAAGVISFDGTALTSLAVRAVAAYHGVQPTVVGGDSLTLEDREEKGVMRVPLLPSGSYLLRYYGGARLFPYVEFSDVLSDEPAVQAKLREQLKGKIVFIGVTSVGLKDIRANPFSKDYPGVEVHATFASNMLSHNYMEMDRRYFTHGYVSILVMVLFVSFFVFRMHPMAAFPVSLLGIGLFQVFAQKFFFDEGLVIPTFIPSAAGVGMLFAGVLYRYFYEANEKKLIRTAFGRYVSGPVVEEILKDHSKLKLGGQKKFLTVMFVDLMGFTKLSERMDATQLTSLLNEYFTRMTRVVLRNQGTLDKYMGDGMMCFWGAPLDLPQHPQLACKAALEMVAELKAINHEWKLRYGLTLSMRIGINSGEMNVGNMGSEQVFSYTVMGDNVNLASRLEGVNNIYGSTIIVSDTTAASAGRGFQLRPLDTVKVKGRDEPVRIHEVVDFQKEGEPRPEWLQAFQQGLDAYRAGRWEEASGAFGTVQTLRGGQDAPSAAFIERIKQLKDQPQSDWDGVWKIASK